MDGASRGRGSTHRPRIGTVPLRTLIPLLAVHTLLALPATAAARRAPVTPQDPPETSYFECTGSPRPDLSRPAVDKDIPIGRLDVQLLAGSALRLMAEDVPYAQVTAALSEALGVTITVDEPLLGQRISVAITHMPVLQALHALGASYPGRWEYQSGASHCYEGVDPATGYPAVNLACLGPFTVVTDGSPPRGWTEEQGTHRPMTLTIEAVDPDIARQTATAWCAMESTSTARATAVGSTLVFHHPSEDALRVGRALVTAWEPQPSRFPPDFEVRYGPLTQPEQLVFDSGLSPADARLEVALHPVDAAGVLFLSVSASGATLGSLAFELAAATGQNLLVDHELIGLQVGVSAPRTALYHLLDLLESQYPLTVRKDPSGNAIALMPAGVAPDPWRWHSIEAQECLALPLSEHLDPSHVARAVAAELSPDGFVVPVGQGLVIVDRESLLSNARLLVMALDAEPEKEPASQASVDQEPVEIDVHQGVGIARMPRADPLAPLAWSREYGARILTSGAAPGRTVLWAGDEVRVLDDPSVELGGMTRLGATRFLVLGSRLEEGRYGDRVALLVETGGQGIDVVDRLDASSIGWRDGLLVRQVDGQQQVGVFAPPSDGPDPASWGLRANEFGFDRHSAPPGEPLDHDDESLMGHSTSYTLLVDLEDPGDVIWISLTEQGFALP